MKNVIKKTLHFFVYILAVFIVVLTCALINDSFSGYNIKTLSGSYVCFSKKQIYTFHEDYVEFITPLESYDYSFEINPGKVTIDNQDFIIYKTGILDQSTNIFYEKVKGFYSLKNE